MSGLRVTLTLDLPWENGPLSEVDIEVLLTRFGSLPRHYGDHGCFGTPAEPFHGHFTIKQERMPAERASVPVTPQPSLRDASSAVDDLGAARELGVYLFSKPTLRSALQTAERLTVPEMLGLLLFHASLAQRNSHKTLTEVREVREEMALVLRDSLEKPGATSEFASSEILDEVRR